MCCCTCSVLLASVSYGFLPVVQNMNVSNAAEHFTSPGAALGPTKLHFGLGHAERIGSQQRSGQAPHTPGGPPKLISFRICGDVPRVRAASVCGGCGYINAVRRIPSQSDQTGNDYVLTNPGARFLQYCSVFTTVHSICRQDGPAIHPPLGCISAHPD